MPVNDKLAREQWLRYVYMRDMGHVTFVKKAERCEDFVQGGEKHWDPADLSNLRAARRPAITVNKVLITLASVTGEQIETRNEISFRPRTGAPTDVAEIHTKLFRFISDQNQLAWARTAMFADGAVTGRGYYDVRLDFSRNLAGDVAITTLNPRTVLLDPDAHEYDPDKWSDVIVTQWYTPDEIELMYNKKDADVLRARAESVWAFGYDSFDVRGDRFGGSTMYETVITDEMRANMRNIRVIERQHRVLKRQRVLIDPRTGMKRDVPDSWTAEQLAESLRENPHLISTTELAKRIRWTVTADDVVLMDEWSPYKHFTVVPYFPVLRYGRTIGLVENLIDPQELLNKTISQELHVVNTMANSGWVVRRGAIINMTMEELEETGARTGLVLEVENDVQKDVMKIQPNPIPSGLDRISFKAENFIKSISGRGDSVMGLDRADVSGRAIDEKKQSADVPLRPALDNLERTDWLMARNVLDIVQQYYTDPRILNITKDDLTGKYETVSVNMPQPGSGEILNDLSLGEYDVVVVSTAAKRTLEDSQFEQALAMREEGIMIPDRFLIENSNLVKKSELVQAMEAQANSAQAQLQEKAKVLSQQLEVANLRADASATEAKALAARAKAAKDMAEVQQGDAGKQAELELKAREHEMEMEHMREKHMLEMQIKREEAQMKLQLQAQEAQQKARQAKIDTVIKAKQAAATPASVDEAAKLARAGGGPAPGGAGAKKPAGAQA